MYFGKFSKLKTLVSKAWSILLVVSDKVLTAGKSLEQSFDKFFNENVKTQKRRVGKCR